jgi:hypothetical protein
MQLLFILFPLNRTPARGLLTKVSRRRFGRTDGAIGASVAWESWLALALFFWARSVNWRQIQGFSDGKKAVLVLPTVEP